MPQTNSTSKRTAQPAKSSRFFTICDNRDGTVDVFLNPTIVTYETADGFKEYDIEVKAVRGIVPWDGLEEDIRRRYDAWCESGETINL